MSRFNKKHIFLTGDRQVGKSTIIRYFLNKNEVVPLKVGGYRTVCKKMENGTSAVHIVRACGKPVLNSENMIMKRFSSESGKEWPELYLDVFETEGVKLLEESRSCDCILMDEIGFAESEAYKFREKIFEILDGDIPVIGVTRKQDTELLNSVKNHNRVLSIEITEENRNKMRKAIKWDAEQRWIIID